MMIPTPAADVDSRRDAMVVVVETRCIASLLQRIASLQPSHLTSHCNIFVFLHRNPKQIKKYHEKKIDIINVFYRCLQYDNANTNNS